MAANSFTPWFVVSAENSVRQYVKLRFRKGAVNGMALIDGVLFLYSLFGGHIPDGSD